jgi:hypothetical protein
MGGGGSPNFSYTFHGDPRATFAQFFGTSNPFENVFNMPGMGGSPHQVTVAPTSRCSLLWCDSSFLFLKSCIMYLSLFRNTTGQKLCK